MIPPLKLIIQVSKESKLSLSIQTLIQFYYRSPNQLYAADVGGRIYCIKIIGVLVVIGMIIHTKINEWNLGIMK